MHVPSDRRIWLFQKSSTPGWLCASSRLCVKFAPTSVAELRVVLEVAKAFAGTVLAGGRHPPDGTGDGVQAASSLPASTPSWLRLLPSMTRYLRPARELAPAQTPVVYEPRKNSSAMVRWSTLSQFGKV